MTPQEQIRMETEAAALWWVAGSMKIPNEEGQLGKYDEVCEFVQHISDAALAAVIILKGKRGDGMSVTCVDRDAAMRLPALLRKMADDIEAKNKLVKAN